MRRLVAGVLLLLVTGCHPGLPGFSPGSTAGLYDSLHVVPYCRGLDEWQARLSARHAAAKELHALSRGCRLTSDYRTGFEQAYIDVALGGDGQVPPLPPRAYWKDRYRTAPGHQAAQQWFAGYATGAERALACRAEYNFVPTSGAPGFPGVWGHSLCKPDPP